ncbi:hypothetical protein Cch01nite_03890 [Cellulomonas chitinilytica]|uniref:Uncharacterized protein n=1 Tax=Cellulomonas chitinilytica TaxID=398759 RepID=A0A919NZX0_9CELL|nr:hypothetical protein Cch01nite_03890 [Cellulomonas chitinilytica]
MAVQWRAGAAGRRPRVVGVLVGGVVAATLAGSLAGCSDGEPGAAAVVDGTVIPTADVRTAKSELNPYLQAVTSLNVLTVLVQAPTVVGIADDEGVGVSDEDARALLDSIVDQSGTKTRPTFSEPSLTVAKYSIAYNNLQALPNAKDVATQIDEDLRALDVTVNPRFGELADGNQISAPSRRPWIVEPKATGGSDDGSTGPTPTPSPS